MDHDVVARSRVSFTTMGSLDHGTPVACKVGYLISPAPCCLFGVGRGLDLSIGLLASFLSWSLSGSTFFFCLDSAS